LHKISLKSVSLQIEQVIHLLLSKPLNILNKYKTSTSKNRAREPKSRFLCIWCSLKLAQIKD
jgi:hypothetical protein